VNAKARRLGAWLLATLALLWLAGCAAPPRAPEEPGVPRWSGRLAVQIDSEPRQSVSAAFDLRGSPERGELSLFTPLGSTAAVMSWAPGRALLREEGRPPQDFVSLDALIDRVLGTPVPVPALFDWLRGTATAVAGWRAELSRQADGQVGRVVARRHEPAPLAELRIVLDTP